MTFITNRPSRGITVTLVLGLLAWLVGLGLYASSPASATKEKDKECTPHFQRYSWTGGPHEENDPPTEVPPDPNWQANVAGDPHGIGQEGPYFRSHGNAGKGDWFYLKWVVPNCEPELTLDAQFTKSVSPATCKSPEVLTFSGTSVVFSEASPISGPATVDVTAAPKATHGWVGGGTETRTVFNGSLSGKLDANDPACRPGAPDPVVKTKVEYDKNCDGVFQREVTVTFNWVWDSKKHKWVLDLKHPVVDKGQWDKVRDLTLEEKIKLGCLKPAPAVDIEKYSTVDGQVAGDYDDEAKGLSPTAEEAISFAVTNTGNVPLMGVVVSDETTAGVGSVSGLSCPDTVLGVAESFVCTGTLSALGYDAVHTDVATVTAKYGKATVTDSDPWNGETPPKGQVVIIEFGTQDPCNQDDVTDNVVWTTPLPEDNDEVTFTEDGRDRTQTLVHAESNTWTDGTTEPIVSTLPEDSGKLCPVKNPPANPPAPHNPPAGNTPNTPTVYEPGHPGGVGVVPAAQVEANPLANPLIQGGLAVMLAAAGGLTLFWFRRRAAA